MASVSAIVPVFNGADTLERCLSSLQAQGLLLREILLIDDGSADGSRALLHQAAVGDSRFRVIEHEANRGLARTLNEGIRLSSGDAVLLIHQDCELQGADWVARAATFLERNPRTVVSGSPVFPIAEMNRTEVAFGFLRDTFFASQEPTEAMGFSEFKCDLVPRDAFRNGTFDEGFRSSGEDQVFSVVLAAAGYRIVRVRALAYVQRFGKARTVRAQLRKEAIYGTAEGGVLVRTSLRVARESSSSRTSGRRLANRASAVLVALALAALGVLLVAGAGWLAVLPLALVVPRILLLATRAAHLRSLGRGPRGGLMLALILVPVNDALYVLAVLRGMLGYAARRRG